MKKFVVPDLSDKRMIFAVNKLTSMGYEIVKSTDDADFVLLPPRATQTGKSINYLANENYALKNAYLTAEAATSLAIFESEKSLINSNVLIIGYGRIGKALHKYLSTFTPNITVSARKSEQRELAKMNGANAIAIDDLKAKNSFDFVFNTVPFPVLNEKELSALKTETLILDLASFPYGVDKHIANAKGIKVIFASGLPARYSPQTAGELVAEAVDEMIREGKI